MIKKISGIYLIKCKANGIVYVGSTVDIKFRWGQHKRSFRRNSIQSNRHLQKDWNEFGEEQFEFSIIEEYDLESGNIEELEKIEQHWIDFYKSDNREFGYNVKGAGNTIHSEETKSLMSKAHKGKVISKQTKEKMKQGHIKNGCVSLKLKSPSLKTRSLSVGGLKKRSNKKKKEVE